ncbi:hypothetical protein BHM03_00058069 [Ensete ventricosum]|nr:hypothetical protein BHM03_00058069 [Ensete ventricosum]
MYPLYAAAAPSGSRIPKLHAIFSAPKPASRSLALICSKRVRAEARPDGVDSTTATAATGEGEGNQEAPESSSGSGNSKPTLVAPISDKEIKKVGCIVITIILVKQPIKKEKQFAMYWFAVYLIHSLGWLQRSE